MAKRNDKLTAYQCCWCSQRIAWSEILILSVKKPTTSMSKSPTEFETQDFYSHVRCMSDRIGPETVFLFRQSTTIEADES